MKVESLKRKDFRLALTCLALSMGLTMAMAQTATAPQQLSSTSIGGGLAGDMPSDVTNHRSRMDRRVAPVYHAAPSDAYQQFTGSTPIITFVHADKKRMGGGMSGGGAAAGLMTSGSNYASTVTADNGGGSTTVTSGPPPRRRTNGHPDIPFPDPLGDAVIPLMLLAFAYICARAFRRKRA